MNVARGPAEIAGDAVPAKPDLETARRTLSMEADAIRSLVARVDERFLAAAEAILSCKGRVVLTGMGKAGMVGEKIAATLASTGTPSLSMHPAEAIHGDLGMVVREDLIVALSNSGETEEIVRLLPYLRKIGATIVAITSAADSTLGRYADVTLAIGRIEEACPLGLAPTASTTAMLALGDALASCVLEARGFSREDYARYHPGGALGRKLLKVSEVMRTGDRVPSVRANATVAETVALIGSARAGASPIVDEAGRLLGIFTDGDFRRHWSKDPGIGPKPVGAHMTSPCLSTKPDCLVGEVQELMSRKRINALPVVDDERRVVGLLDIQDIVRWPLL